MTGLYVMNVISLRVLITDLLTQNRKYKNCRL